MPENLRHTHTYLQALGLQNPLAADRATPVSTWMQSRPQKTEPKSVRWRELNSVRFASKNRGCQKSGPFTPNICADLLTVALTNPTQVPWTPSMLPLHWCSPLDQRKRHPTSNYPTNSPNQNKSKLYIAEATNLDVLSVGLLPEPSLEADPGSFQVLAKS